MTLLRKTGDTVKRSTLVPRNLNQDVPKGLTRRAFLSRAGLAAGGGYDQVRLAGGGTLSPAGGRSLLRLNFSNGFIVPPGASFTLFNVAGATGGVGGQLRLLPAVPGGQSLDLNEGTTFTLVSEL